MHACTLSICTSVIIEMQPLTSEGLAPSLTGNL